LYIIYAYASHITVDRYYVHIAEHGSLTSWRRRSDGGKRERKIRRGKAKKEEGGVERDGERDDEWEVKGEENWKGNWKGKSSGVQ
jgi:hypothetical protein